MEEIMFSVKKILPIEVNLELRNITEYLKPVNLDIQQKSSKTRVFLLDAASYNNLGDQAITYAISLFLKDLFGEDCYVEISERELLRNLKYLKKVICSEDILCLNGGGNMGTLYPRYEALRRKVIKAFPDNKIIIFPQTIDYESDLYGKRELKRSGKVYNGHKHLVVCAREKKSFDLMKQLYKNVAFVPDIVLYLKGRIALERAEKKDCVGICLRNDKETVVSLEQKKSMYSAIKEAGFIVENLTTMSDLHQMYLCSDDRLEALRAKLQEFSQYKCIITDRLHGMIFSLLSGVPCLAIDNSNKKVSEVLQVLDSAVPVQIIHSNEFEDIPVLIEKLFLKAQNANSWNVNLDAMYSELKKLLR